MPEITNFDEAEKALMRYMPLAKKMTGRDMTVGRMAPMMQALGNPETKLNAIHIAGTSGKTSTTYFITSLLVQSGKKVGTTVSPHIDSVAERVQINGKPISEKQFCGALSEFLNLIDGIATTPTYFELMIGFAFWYFVKAKVDYAVIETGLGGLHDSTNILTRKDKICVITDIGFDHMDILGNTLPLIAAQKAGIIHENNILVMYEQSTEIMKVFKEHCQNNNAELNILNFNNDENSMLPKFQQRNWQLAYKTYELLKERDGLKALDLEETHDAMNVQVPGRMDKVKLDTKTLVMDGAHNSQKMRAFVDGFKQQYPFKQAAVLLSLKSDKDYESIFPMIGEISDNLIITSFSLSQDIPVESADLDALKNAAAEYFERITVIQDQNLAYAELIRQDEELLIITGSFYLIGQLRKSHKELINA